MRITVLVIALVASSVAIIRYYVALSPSELAFSEMLGSNILGFVWATPCEILLQKKYWKISLSQYILFGVATSYE